MKLKWSGFRRLIPQALLVTSFAAHSAVGSLMPAVALGTIVLPNAMAQAATYYVSPTGNDDNRFGTEAAPFRTIARGSHALAPGDTLLIRAGTYAEAMWHNSGGFVFCNGLSKAAMTRYSAYAGDEGKVIIKPPSGLFVVWFPRTARHIEIRGLILDGTNTTNQVVKIDASYTADEFPPPVRLLRNELRYGKSSGIQGGGEAEIIGNRIHHMKTYGIYAGGSNGLVEGNIFHDNGGYAIHIYNVYGPLNNWVVRNNVFYGNGRGYNIRLADGSLRWQSREAVVISRGRGNQFYNNLLYNNFGGVSVWSGGHDTLVANNTVYGNDTFGIDVSKGIQNARVINNISWGNKGAQIQNLGTNTTIQNNTTTDPGVVNAAGGDFHLRSGSPAIGGGLNLFSWGVTTDFMGNARPKTGPFDRGAYQFVSSTGSRHTPLAPAELQVR